MCKRGISKLADNYFYESNDLNMRKALGKGLGALIPDADRQSGATRAAAKPNRIPIEQIAPSRFQPRITFDDTHLQQLVESIRTQGIIEPLILRPAPEGSSTRYELVAGERRWRAAQKAGLEMVPVVIREMTDREALETALTENLQREDLNAIEEARAYRMLIDEFSMTQEEVASRVGVDRVTVTNALRLLKLESEIQDDIIWGRITAGHSRALLQVDGVARKQLHKQVIEKGLSVREAEAIARKISEKADSKRPPQSKSEADDKIISAINDLEEKLRAELGTKVVIRLGKRGGSVEIMFANKDQLEGICHRIME